MRTKIISLFLAGTLLPAFALALDSDTTPKIPQGFSDIPCRAEMEAFTKLHMPSIARVASSTKPSSPAPTPQLSNADMSAAQSALNSAEAKALNECLMKNLPAGAGGAHPKLPGSSAASDMAGPKSTTSEDGCPIIMRTLMRGSRGEDVKTLQTYLISEELLEEGFATGYFGALTEAAVKAWQEDHGIDPIGIVGPKTRAALANCAG